MDSNNPPRKKMMAAAGVLSLDDLPDSILEKVLTHLPIRDAAKTSILSKNWKEHWRNIPSLIFDNSFHSSDSVQDQLQYLMDMSLVLLHHRGSIHKFTLSMSLAETYHPRIDTVMLFLRDRDVQELTFNVIPPEDDDTYTFYKIPSYLFSYQQLRHLDLSHCEFIPPPPTFEGFPHLISLRFYFVNYWDEDETDEILPHPLDIVSKSPLLENLYIENCVFRPQTCYIDAPKLKSFHLGCVHTYFFKNTPLLSYLHIRFLYEFETADGFVMDELVATKFTRLFDCLPVVEHLCIAQPVELMPREEEQLLTSPRLPITISHLKVLELAADFNSASGILLVIALTISCPNLKRLKLNPDSWKLKRGLVPPVIDLFKREDLADVSFQNLEELQMLFYGRWMEVEFIKFMVARSVVLKTVTLYYLGEYKRRVSIIGAKLASASPKVNIKLVEVENVHSFRNSTGPDL